MRGVLTDPVVGLASSIIMSEYWVSQQKYYCKFCNCWLANNKPSIQVQ